MTQQKIKIEALISADLSKVWASWTKPEHITQWNFATPEWQWPTAQNDLRVGGKYCARMEARDGSFGFDFEAVYDEVTNQKRLSYTMPDGRKVITDFESAGAATKITTVFDAETENSVDMQKSGWQSILNNFKAYVEGH